MATIRIDLDRVVGNVDRRIFGNFVEHLGRCIYGGIYEEGSPLSDERGFRRDVLDAVRGLRVPVLRWPGGNFVSGYHWPTASARATERPRRMELAWHARGVQPLRHRRVHRVLPRPRRRALHLRQHGHRHAGRGPGLGRVLQRHRQHPLGQPAPPERPPRALRRASTGASATRCTARWQIGALNAEDYVKKAIEFAKVMKWTDPTIQLVGCGDQRLERLGRDGARRAWRPTSTSTASTSTPAATTTTATSSRRTRPSAPCASPRR